MNDDVSVGGIEVYIERDEGVIIGDISVHTIPSPLIIATASCGSQSRMLMGIDRLDGFHLACAICGFYDYRFQVPSVVRLYLVQAGRTFELAFLFSMRDSELDLPGTKSRIPASF